MAKNNLTFLTVSQRTIELLESRGMTQTEIAKFLLVSKSFISRVKAGTRSFTLQHLADVSLKFDEPLALLLFRITPPETIDPRYRGLYDLVQQAIDPKPTKRKKKTKAA